MLISKSPHESFRSEQISSQLERKLITLTKMLFERFLMLFALSIGFNYSLLHKIYGN